LRDIVPNTGVCALVDRKQVAVFRIGRGEEVYAIANFDPNAQASVLSRGWSATLASASWWRRRSTSTTSTCAPANAWKRPSTRWMPIRAGLRRQGLVATAAMAREVRGRSGGRGRTGRLTSIDTLAHANSQNQEDAHDAPVSSHAKPRLVVVGNGMAGMRTVEELLKLAPDLYDITVFGAEPHGNYNRILLSRCWPARRPSTTSC
jgi:hypothetical protein